MGKATQFQITSRLSELSRLADVVKAFGGEHQLPPKTVYELRLALDEILSNTIQYAFADDGLHSIGVRLTLDCDWILVEVEDDGLPFDPTTAAQPDTNAPCEEREPGGLGIHFARSVMDEIHYDRRQHKNILSMRKHVGKGAPPV